MKHLIKDSQQQTDKLMFVNVINASLQIQFCVSKSQVTTFSSANTKYNVKNIANSGQQWREFSLT